MENRTVEILKIEFDATDAIKATTELRSARQKLREENKSLSGDLEKNSVKIEQNNAKIKLLTTEISRNEKQTQLLAQANVAAAGSYEQLLREQQLAEIELKNTAGLLERNANGTIKFTQAYFDASKRVDDAKQALLTFNAGISQGNTNVGNYGNTLQGLRERLNALRSEIQTTDVGSDRFKEASDEAANLGLQIGQLEGKLDEFGNKEPKNPAKKAFEDGLSTAVTFTSAINLLNQVIDDGTPTAEALAKATQGMAIAQSIANIAKEKGAVLDTLALVKTKALGVAQLTYSGIQRLVTALTVQFGVTATAAWAAATLGISVLITGIVALVANFKAVKQAVTDFFGLTSESERASRELTNQLNKQAEASERSAENAKTSGELINDQLEREIKLRKSLGQTTIDLEIRKQQEIKKTALIEGQALSARLAALFSIQNKTDEDRKRIKEVGEAIAAQTKVFKDAANEITVIENTEQTKQADNAKKAAEKASENKKKADDEAKENEKQYQERLADLKEKFILDDRQRLEKSFKDQLDSVRKGTADELKLREEIQKQQADALAKFDKEAADKKTQKELDDKLKSINDQIALDDILRQNELDQADLSIKNEEEKNLKKAEINLRYLQLQLANVQALADADGQRSDIELANIEKAKNAIEKAQGDIVKLQETDPPKTIGELFGVDPEGAEIIDKGIAQFQQSLGNVIEIIKKRYAAELENIEEARDAEIESIKQSELSEEEKSAKIDGLNRTVAQRKYELQVKQFNADKALQLSNAIISSATAVIKTFAELGPIAGPIGAAIVGGISAAQIAIIAAQKAPAPPKFATGVVGLNGPGNATSDSIPAMLSNGESVITASGTRFAETFYPGLLNFLNTKNKFADGVVNFQQPLGQSANISIASELRAAIQDLTIVTKVSDIEKATFDRQSVRTVGVI